MYRVFIEAEGYVPSIVAIFVDLIEICGSSLIKHYIYPTMPVLVAARWLRLWVRIPLGGTCWLQMLRVVR